MNKTCTRPAIPLLAAALLAIVASPSVRADYQSTVQADGPLTYYRFNESPVVTMPFPTTATNLGTLGAAADGSDVPTGTSDSIAKGLAGPMAASDPTSLAYRFPGANNNYLNIPNQTGLAVSGPFTVEFWAKPSKPTTFNSAVTFAQWTGNRSGWIVNQSDANTDTGSGWQFRGYKNSGTTAAFSAAVTMTLDANHWYHVVCVYDGSTAKLYVDGVLKASGSASGYVPCVSPYSLTLGSRGNHNSSVHYEWPGNMSEFAFYATALTADEVAAHYGAATTNAAGYPAMILAKNPACYLRLNEPYSNSVAINSGTGGTTLAGAYGYYSTSVPELQAPAYGGMGTSNTVLKLDGANPGYVLTPSLAAAVTSATFECWLKRDGTQADTAGLMIHRNGNATYGLSFQTDGQQLAYNWNDAANTWQWNSGLIPPDGRWAYVALVVSPSQAILYLYDGTNWTSATNFVSHSSATFSVPAYIGWDTLAASRHYNGLLDEAAFYTKALTPNQLRAHALVGFGDTHPPVLVTDPPMQLTKGTLYAGWPFSLGVEAYGVPPLTYQWRKNGVDLPAATNTTYTVSEASTSDNGQYDVVVTNPNGSTTNTQSLNISIVTSAPDIASNLRTWFKLDETSGYTTRDSSGNGHQGTLQGFWDETSMWVPGCISNALAINPYYGAQQVVLVADDGSLDFSANREFTLAAWVNANASAQGVNGGIIAKGYGNGDEQYSLDLDSGHYRFFVRDGAGTARVLTTSVAPNGFWQHVCASYSAPNGTMKVYVNGVEVASATPPATLLTNNHEVSIGSRQQANYEGAPYDFNLVGLMDDSRIYSRALVPAEVQALYKLAPIFAPAITEEPQGRFVFQGGTVTLSVGIAGTPPFRYQWYRNGTTAVAGATNAILVLTNVNSGSAGNYHVVASTGGGSTNSVSAAVSLLPASADTYEGQVVIDKPEAYWRLNETTPGTIADSMGRHDGTPYALGHADTSGSYFNGYTQAGALVNNPDTSILFNRATHNLVYVPYSVDLNASTFSVECWANLNSLPANSTWYGVFATRDISDSLRPAQGYILYAGIDGNWDSWMGSGDRWTLAYGSLSKVSEWTHIVLTYDSGRQSIYVNGSLIDSSGTPFYPNPKQPFYIGASGNESSNGDLWFDGFIDEVAYYRTALDAGRINAHYVLGGYGTNSLPVVTQPPVSQTVQVGSTATFTATALGAPTLAYQWKRDGVNVPGANSLTLTVTNVYYTDSGSRFQLSVTNSVGAAISSPAILTVTPPPSITNLVVRPMAGTGSTVLELIWPAGTLYSATNVLGPWTIVSGATVPYYQVTTTNAQQFFRCQ